MIAEVTWGESANGVPFRDENKKCILHFQFMNAIFSLKT